MKKIFLIISISILLTACCTKIDCVFVLPSLIINFKGEIDKIEVNTLYDGVKSSTKTYNELNDTILTFPIDVNNQNNYSIEIIVGDSTFLFEDFKTAVEILEIDCNKCFLKNEKAEKYSLSSFKVNNKTFNQNSYEIWF